MFGINRLDMRVVPNSLAARASGGDLSVGLGPTMHLFYRQRVVDIDDRLLKYLGGWDGPEFQPCLKLEYARKAPVRGGSIQENRLYRFKIWVVDL